MIIVKLNSAFSKAVKLYLTNENFGHCTNTDIVAKRGQHDI